MAMQASDTKRTYIVLAALIDDFVIACADRATLDKFRGRFLDERTEVLFILPCCEIERDLLAGTTTKQYAEDIRRYPVHIRRLGLLSLSFCLPDNVWRKAPRTLHQIALSNYATLAANKAS